MPCGDPGGIHKDIQPTQVLHRLMKGSDTGFPVAQVTYDPFTVEAAGAELPGNVVYPAAGTEKTTLQPLSSSPSAMA